MRIVAIADLHGHLGFDIPACDLLIIAGDICPDFAQTGRGSHDSRLKQQQWLYGKFREWLSRQPHKQVLYTFGNHDWLGSHLAVDDVALTIDTLRYVPMPSDSDPNAFGGGIVKIWLSPWSNEFNGWAWMKPHADLKTVYDQIPVCADIIVSHQPPYGYGDGYLDMQTGKMDHLGSIELRDAMDRVKPQVLICGHLHAGYGQYRHSFTGEGDGATEPFTTIYNVSVVNEAYKLVNKPTVIDLF